MIESQTKKIEHSECDFLIRRKVVINHESLRPEPKKSHTLSNFLKLGIIIFWHFMGPSPFHEDLSSSCAMAVAMNMTFDNMKASLKKWEQLIEVTGGFLVPNKSSWYLMDYVWNKRKWSCTDPQNIQHQLEAKLQDGTIAPLTCLKPLDSMEMLGIHLSPSGNQTQQIQVMKDITQTWADKIWVGYLQRGEVWVVLQTTI